MKRRSSISTAPFLALHPWVGYLIFVVFTLAFLFTTVQVIDKGPLVQQDTPTITAIHNWAKVQPLAVSLPMRILSSLGRDGLALICAILFVIWLKRKHERELGMVILGVFGGELWFQVLSNIFNRQRPEFKDPFEKLIGPGFPSGHATTAVLLSWLIISLLWRYWSPSRRVLYTAILVILSLAIGFSRLFLGLHYPSDVFAGYCLGLAWGGFVYTSIDLYFYRRRIREKQASVAD